MIPRREEGVTHVIEFTFALTLFLIIIQAFSTTMDFRIGVDLDSNDNRIAAAHIGTIMLRHTHAITIMMLCGIITRAILNVGIWIIITSTHIHTTQNLLTILKIAKGCSNPRKVGNNKCA